MEFTSELTNIVFSPSPRGQSYIIELINQGIDAYLQAVEFEHEFDSDNRLHLNVTKKTVGVLIRRMLEHELGRDDCYEDDEWGWDEYGQFMIDPDSEVAVLLRYFWDIEIHILGDDDAEDIGYNGLEHDVSGSCAYEDLKYRLARMQTVVQED